MRALVLMVMLLAGSGRSASGASIAAGATDPACANPSLPAAILRADAPQPPVPLPTVVASAPLADLVLAVAADEPTRQTGLMCVLALHPHAGMLFVFATESEQEFWMKNTLVPLDMVWLRSDGAVDRVAADVPASTRRTPDDRVARRTGVGRYVIELPAGEARDAGLERGVRVRLPTGINATS